MDSSEINGPTDETKYCGSYRTSTQVYNMSMSSDNHHQYTTWSWLQTIISPVYNMVMASDNDITSIQHDHGFRQSSPIYNMIMASDNHHQYAT